MSGRNAKLLRRVGAHLKLRDGREHEALRRKFRSLPQRVKASLRRRFPPRRA